MIENVDIIITFDMTLRTEMKTVQKCTYNYISADVIEMKSCIKKIKWIIIIFIQKQYVLYLYLASARLIKHRVKSIMSTMLLLSTHSHGPC